MSRIASQSCFPDRPLSAAVSSEEIERLGSSEAALVRARWGRLDSCHDLAKLAQSRLDQLLFDVPENERPQITILGRRGLGANAFAVPTSSGRGEILLTPELFEMLAYVEQLDAVILHETVHLLEKHAAVGINAPGLKSVIGSQRLGEYRADARAFMMMHDPARGTNPEGMFRLLERFGSDCPHGWDAAHGSVSDRIQNLRALQHTIELTPGLHPASRASDAGLTKFELHKEQLSRLERGDRLRAVLTDGSVGSRIVADPTKWVSAVEKLFEQLSSEERIAALLVLLKCAAAAQKGAPTVYASTVANAWRARARVELNRTIDVLFKTDPAEAFFALLDILDIIGPQPNRTASRGLKPRLFDDEVLQDTRKTAADFLSDFSGEILPRLATRHKQRLDQSLGGPNLAELLSDYLATRVKSEGLNKVLKPSEPFAQLISMLALQSTANCSDYQVTVAFAVLKALDDNELSRPANLKHCGLELRRNIAEICNLPENEVIYNCQTLGNSQSIIDKVREAAIGETSLLTQLQQEILSQRSEGNSQIPLSEAERFGRILCHALVSRQRDRAQVSQCVAMLADPQSLLRQTLQQRGITLTEFLSKHVGSNGGADLAWAVVRQQLAPQAAISWAERRDTASVLSKVIKGGISPITTAKERQRVAISWLTRLSELSRTLSKHSSPSASELEELAHSLIFIRELFGVNSPRAIEGTKWGARDIGEHEDRRAEIRAITRELQHSVSALYSRCDDSLTKRLLLESMSLLCEDDLVAARVAGELGADRQGRESFEQIVKRIEAANTGTRTLSSRTFERLEQTASAKAQLDCACDVVERSLGADSAIGAGAMGGLVIGEFLAAGAHRRSWSSIQLLRAGLLSAQDGNPLRNFCVTIWESHYQNELFDQFSDVGDWRVKHGLQLSSQVPVLLERNDWSYISPAQLERSLLLLTEGQKMLLLRELLGGRDGVLLSDEGKDQLCALLLDSALGHADKDERGRIQRFVRTFLDQAPLEDVALLLSKVFSNRFLCSGGSAPDSWQAIAERLSQDFDGPHELPDIDDLSKLLEKRFEDSHGRTLTNINEIPRRTKELKDRELKIALIAPRMRMLLEGSQHSRDKSKGSFRGESFADFLLRESSLSGAKQQGLLSPEQLVVEIGKQLRPPGVRLLQLACQFFDLPEHYRRAFDEIFDSTKAQSKLSCWRTLKIAEPEYADQIVEFGEPNPVEGDGRLGGGAMYSVWKVKLKDGSTEVVKILCPNALEQTKRVCEFLSLTVRELKKTDPAYTMAPELINMVQEWIEAEVGDSKFLENDRAFREHFQGAKLCDGTVEVVVPKSFSTRSPRIQREEFIDAPTIGRLARTDKAAAGRALQGSWELFLRQLMEGTPVLSDVGSQGNTLVMRDGKIVIIDRGNYLIFSDEERFSLLSLLTSQQGEGGAWRAAIVPFLSSLPENQGWKPSNDCATQLSRAFSQLRDEAGIDEALFAATQAGLVIPSRYRLLVKNIKGFMAMAREFEVELPGLSKGMFH